MSDSDAMIRCLALAEKGRGFVKTNPLVGAVLVREGRIIAEAWHEGFGLAHAEKALLDRFNEKILPSDVLYVNLEPCCHTGKTPPCTETIIERDVRQLVYGMRDPDPRVGGKGIERLLNAGVTVRGPVERARSEWINRGFISLCEKGRPWITVKKARNRGGLIANEDRSPLKITSLEQDRWTHRWLRAGHDAILVGVGTILTDNPALTVRFEATLDRPHPFRIVLDPHLRIPLGFLVVSDDLLKRTLLVTGEGEEEKRKVLEGRGVLVERVAVKGGAFEMAELWKILASHGIASVLVEGGAKTWAVMENEKSLDEEVILVGASF